MHGLWQTHISFKLCDDPRFPSGLTDPDFPGSSGMDCNETELPSYFPQIQPNVIMTAVVVILFASVKTFYDRVRHERARVSVVVLGAGPIGLTAALLALKTRRVSKLTIYETIDKIANLKKDYQIAIDRRSVSFLRKAGVDFDNLEGCWDNKCFYTRVGIYLEYMLTTLRRCNKNTVTKFSCKVRQSTCIKPQPGIPMGIHVVKISLGLVYHNVDIDVHTVWLDSYC